jgi:hypothetical protein
VVEIAWLQVASYHRFGHICRLFSFEQYFPKLDVAGSNPVSRSMFSMAWFDAEGLYAKNGGNPYPKTG